MLRHCGHTLAGIVFKKTATGEGGFAMADVKTQKQHRAKVLQRESVMAKEEDQRDEEFNRELALTVKRYLKPDFDQINSHLSQLDTRLASLETSNGDIQNKLSQLINKLG
jgi:hypothetical protein